MIYTFLLDTEQQRSEVNNIIPDVTSDFENLETAAGRSSVTEAGLFLLANLFCLPGLLFLCWLGKMRCFL